MKRSITTSIFEVVLFMVFVTYMGYSLYMLFPGNFWGKFVAFYCTSYGWVSYLIMRYEL